MARRAIPVDSRVCGTAAATGHRTGMTIVACGALIRMETVDGLGVPVLLHSCGNINAYLDDLTQTKIVAIHPLQRTAGMDLRTVKERYGQRVCIIGNVDSSRTLPFGTPADVAEEVRDAIDIAAPGGGFILASDHSLHDGIPIENIVELFRTGAEYGRAVYQSRD